MHPRGAMRTAWLAPLVFALACSESHVAVCAAGGTCVVAGVGESGPAGDDGPAVDAQLALPVDVTVGPDGLLYVVDMGNFRIRRIDEAGTIHTVLGTGALGEVRAGPALETDMSHASQVVFVAPNEMLVAAWHDSVVLSVDLERSHADIVAGTGERDYRGDGGAATEAAFDLPSAIASSPGGELLVTDQANQVIRRIDADGVVHRFAGRCVVGTCDGSAAPSACPDSDKLVCAGEPFACDALCAPAFAGDTGAALDASLGFPSGAAASPAGRLITAPDGSVYVADTANHRVRRIDPSGAIETVAGTGERGFGGDGGAAIAAQLTYPTDVALAPDGTLFIADAYNHCVRAVAPDGVIRTAVGVCGTRGDGPSSGPPESTLLTSPHGIDVGPDGSLYIADTGNHRIRMLVR